jgi:hypothetical protein
LAAFGDNTDALDGEEFTNKILTMAGGGDERRPNQQMCPIGADFKHFLEAEFDEFSAPLQGLVNHASQGLVNHAGESLAGDVGLTSLLKQNS